MKYLFLALAIVFIIVVITLFLKLKILISYEQRGKNAELSIQFSVLQVIKYKIHIPEDIKEDDSPSFDDDEVREGPEENSVMTDLNSLYNDMQNIKNFNHYLTYALGFHMIIKSFLKKVIIHNIQWQTIFGAGDAAMTGSFTGMLWAVKGNVVGLAGNYFKLKKQPHIIIEPKFDQLMLNTSFLCILSFRIGHAIFAGIRLIRHLKKGRQTFSKKVEETVGRNINV